ncbi:unnamed protein product [Parnassius mnemosyne]|uniref:Pinin/SDK/MemA protein domain-containing protein n=1 Tax=Parnassius mnemosyne TaxID=213953 RepID=A0AAV1KQ37_9NEOP
MGTEIAISFSSLRTQLENEKSSLFKIDENIKKIVQTSGRFSNDRFNPTGHYARGGHQQIGGRNSFSDYKNQKNDDQFAKRKNETKTVFSRLSARVQDSDGEDDGPGIKRAKVPSAVSRELPSRAAVLRAQGDDEQARTRNRRIFGSLLGTLQKFKQEEIGLQTKEEKKAQVERKIEEQARLEKEREQKERKTLFAEREHKKATIKALEAKMARVQEFEKWEASQKSLANFILTKAKPHVYWLPKKMTDKATEKLNSSRKFHEKYMIKKRLELQDELQRIEQRCLRPRGPGTKENEPNHVHDEEGKEHEKAPVENSGVVIKNEEEDKGRKRNKFAMDVDEKEKEDSDADDRHEEASTDKPQEDSTDKPQEASTDKPQEENVTEENKMDTNTEEEAAVVKAETVKGTEPKEVKENLESSKESTAEENTNNESQDVEMKDPVDNSEHS